MKALLWLYPEGDAVFGCRVAHDRVAIVLKHHPAIASISTCAPSGSAATATVVRAGYGAAKCLAYTSFISAKSRMSVRYTFTFTTSPRDLCAALSITARLCKICPV